MGNRMTVARPYIIDEYLSEDEDDDDDDYFNYETAYDTEGADQNVDEKEDDYGNAGDSLTVNSQVVNSLVKEVETLLTYLDKEDYEGAHKAARVLKKGGGEGQDFESETKPLLSEENQPLSQYSEHRQGHTNITTNVFHVEGVPLLSQEENTKDDDWASKHRCALWQLDRDLTSFEENESRVESDDPEDVKPRRKRKSSLPRLKRDSAISNGGDGGGSVGQRRSGSQSRESSLSRSSPRLPRSPASGIPRFCYKAASSTSKQAGTAPNATTCQMSSSKGLSCSESDSKFVDEAITTYVKSFTSQSMMGSKPDSINQGQRSRYREVKQGGEGVQAWEINISDMTGRVKKNKKRSGIPSLWTNNQSPDEKSEEEKTSSHYSTKSLSSCTNDSLHNLSLDIDNLVDSPVNQTYLSVNVSKWDMGGRKVFDQKRWNCISRPQYRTSCGISSVVSCWNFLFSTLGHGHLHPLSQEDAMTILGFEAPFNDIKFGPFTGNLTLMRWFRQLNSHFKVFGKSYYMYKPCGRNKTMGVTSSKALDNLKIGLRDKHTAFIYHCHNHYFCPVGFEESPLYPVEAYNEKLSAESVEKTWVLIGETSRKYGPLHCKSWEEICLDLKCESPDYYNIRQSWNGVMTHQNSKRKGGTLHCIMCFQTFETNRHYHFSNNSNSPRPFHLHPQSSYNPSLDGGSDCDTTEESMRESFYKDRSEEDAEIESVSVEDFDDNSSNFDADSLS